MTREDLRRKSREAWARLRGGELTPLRAALSVAVGLALGVTPLYGFHLLMVLAVCIPLRLDAPVSYLAANISIPLIAPFLVTAEVEIGSLILTGSLAPTDVSVLRAHGAGVLIKELVVGTLVFSPSVAALGGSIAFAFVTAWKERAAAGRSQAIERVAERYGSVGNRAAYHYVRSKLARDPVARRIVELSGNEPLGDVIDAGCGRGQLALLLLEDGRADSVCGFDWDAPKVAVATRASTGLRATFSLRDLREPVATSADTALLIDVLQRFLRRGARGDRAEPREGRPPHGHRA